MFREWRKHSGPIRQEFNVSNTFQGWSTRAGVQLRGVPKTPRVIDTIDCAWAGRLFHSSPTDTVAALTHNFWVNTSQAVQRRPWSFDHAGVITPRSSWYSFAKDVALDGIDSLRVQGLPINIETTGLEDEKLCDLAGNGYSCPVIAAALLALYWQPWAVWWQE